MRAFRQATAEAAPRIEVFLSRAGEPAPAVLWPSLTSPEARTWLAPFLGPDGALPADPVGVEALLAAWAAAPAEVRRHLRVSRHFDAWLDRLRRQRSREDSRAAMVERMRAMMEASSRARLRILTPEERLVEEMRSRLGESASRGRRVPRPPWAASPSPAGRRSARHPAG